jgi:putative aldouronate transport system substrate-binding protein
MIEANKINGKTYGVPFDSGWYKTFTFLIRKDIREKHGFPEIKSYEDLEKFMYLVKEKEPDLVPYIPHGREFIGLEIPMVLNPEKKMVKSTVAPGIIYFKGNDGKVYNMFDEPEPILWDSWLYARKLYLDGILSKDTMQLFVQDFVKGKGAVSVAYGDAVKISDQTAIAKAVPGAEIESWSPFGADPDLKLVSNFKSGNFMAIPVTSRNKERAMMFLDWMVSSQENYDLFAYGIEGRDYEIVDGDCFRWKLDTQWYYFAWAWVQNPTQDRMQAGLPENAKAALAFRANADNFEPDIALGWEFDRSPVKNEIAQYNAAAKEMLNPIMQGVVDPAVEFPKFKEKVYPIVKKIQEEMQRSLDEYLKNKK